MSRVDSRTSNWTRAACARLPSLLAAIALFALPQLALSQTQVAQPQSTDQLAAPGNQAPLALNVSNVGASNRDVLWAFTSDTTGGAVLNGLGDVDAAPNEWAIALGPGTTNGPTLTLGPNEGEVFVYFCDAIQAGPSDFACASVPPAPSFRVRSATLAPVTPLNEPVDQGQTVTTEAHALNGGMVDAAATIPVSFSIVGPATAISPTNTTSGASPAAFTFQVNPSAPPGSTITVSATRTDVANVPKLDFVYVVNDYQLLQISPPDGTIAQGGSNVDVIVELRLNGSPLRDNTINFVFASNPNSSVLLSPNGTTDPSGRAGTTVTIGSPNPGTPPADVVVRAFFRQGDPIRERIVDFIISPRDTIAFGSVSGDNQSAAINSAFAQPLSIRSTRNGAPDVGSTLNWSVSPPGAATLASTTTTGPNGDSSNNVTAGSTSGPFTVTVTHADDPSITYTYNLAAVDKRLIKPTSGSGDGQTGTPGQPVAQPLVAVATANGAAESGVIVNWSVVSGSAIITGTTNPTDNLGRSTAQVQFGPSAGTVTIQAQRNDIATEIQTYTLTAVNSFTLEKPPSGSGDGQQGFVGQTLSDPLVVIARNNGQPASGVTVLWTVSGDATISPTQTVTQADGKSSVTLTFGSTPGTVTVTATRQDAPSATSSFVVKSTTFGAPQPGLEKPADSGDLTSAPIGTEVLLSVVTTFGTATQSEIAVVWELVSGSAQLNPARTISDANGVARTRVTLGPNAGPVVVRAVRPDGGNPQTYNLTAVDPTGAILSLHDGNNQTGGPGTTAAPLRVRYTRSGQAIANATITWDVVSGSATLSGRTSLTDATGVAQIGLVFGQTPGEVVVRAAAGNASVLFTLRVLGSDSISLRLVSGNRQTGPIGTRADLPIVIEVLKGTGEIAPGERVDWRVVSGSATLDALQTTSGPDGRISQGLRFGSTAGPIRLRAELPGSLPLISVDIDATSFVPTLSIVSGNNQNAPVSSPLTQDLVVGISAPAGKTLAGVVVRWQVVAGGGTLTSATSTTAANGQTNNRLTLGPNPGENKVTASIDGGGSVTFTANGGLTSAPLTIVSGNGQTLPTATPSAPLVVELKTANGQPVPGVALDWSATNATFAGGTVVTNTDTAGRSSNVVELTLPGPAVVTVKVRGITPVNQVVFTLNGGVANVPTLQLPEETVARAIDLACPALVGISNPTPEQADLLARCLELVNNAGDHPDQVENALDQLQQDTALAQANAALVAASTQFDNLKTRIAALRSGKQGADFSGLALATSTGVMPLSFLPSSVVQEEGQTEGGGASDEGEIGADFSRWGFFASGIVGRGEQDAGSVTPEYDYDTTGLTAGIDYRVNDSFIVGVSLGYNQQDTDLSDDSGGIDTKGWSISGYTSYYRQSNWYFDGVLTYGSNDYDLTRSIVYDIVGAGGAPTRVDQVAEASTDGDQLSLALSAGKDFQKGAWNFGPYVRGTYTRVEFDSYEERLSSGPGSGLGLAVEARELESMTAVFGGKVTYAMSRDWGILMPHMQLEWEHEFEDDPQRLVTRFLNDPTSTRILADGDPVDSNYFNIGIGLSALFPGGRSAFFYYEHLAGSEGLSQDNLSLGVRIEF